MDMSRRRVGGGGSQPVAGAGGLPPPSTQRQGGAPRELKAALYLFCCLLLVVSLAGVVSTLFNSFRGTDGAVTEQRQKSPDVLQLEGKVHELWRVDNDEERAKWIDVLRTAPIEFAAPYERGLAPKYILLLEGGWQAVAKPMEPPHVLHTRSLREVAWSDLSVVQRNYSSRAEWRYQGWSEVAAAAVDHVVGWRKKPPTTSRYVPIEVLWSNENTWRAMFLAGNGMVGSTVRSILRWMAPSSSWIVKGVPVSIEAWIDGLHTALPGHLRFRSLADLSRPVPEDAEKAMQLSDKTVHDFLLEDHDATVAHNFKSLADGTMLHWDSGLAWRHGPTARDMCLDLLCGVRDWAEEETRATGKCSRLCTFRAATIERLAQIQASGQTIGQRMLEYLQHEPVSDVFSLGIYHQHTLDRYWADFGKWKFRARDFAEGLDRNVALLLSHVNQCLETYPRDRVLL